jgi:hypothetical protein
MSEDLLHRQVHPSWLQAGRPASLAFRPSPKDKKQLSVDLGRLVTAQQSFEAFTQVGGFVSAGVWSVSENEARVVGVPVVPDPIKVPYDNPAHALIDFRERSNSKIHAAAQQLARFASDRGCQYAKAK